MNILFLVIGALLLTVGGEILIRGALSASARQGFLRCRTVSDCRLRYIITGAGGVG